MVINRLMSGKKPTTIWDELDPTPVPAPRSLRRLTARPLNALADCFDSIPIGALVALIGVAVAVGALLPYLHLAEDLDYSHRYPTPVATNDNSFDAVAGEYRLGGLGLNWALSILPDGRYSFRWSGCMGVYHRESGLVKRVGHHLVLSAAEPIESRIPRVFLPVKWSRRTYLIPPEKLEKFSEAIIKGNEPRNEHASGRFYVVGLAEPVGGMPELPEPWATFLRKNAVIGKIVEVRERGRVKVDVGSANGINAECTIAVQGRDHLSTRQLTFVAINEQSSLADELYRDDHEKPLAVGDKLVVARYFPSD